jgi:hypothetical protein
MFNQLAFPQGFYPCHSVYPVLSNSVKQLNQNGPVCDRQGIRILSRKMPGDPQRCWVNFTRNNIQLTLDLTSVFGTLNPKIGDGKQGIKWL